jgi:ubiquinone biosynthesis protein
MNRARREQIIATFVRHGLGYLVGALGVATRIPHGREHADRDRSSTGPEQLRLAFEELGPTFIKLGQLLSTRSDLLPPAYIAQLAKLQDSAPAVAREAIRQSIHEELGADPEQLFASFEWTPLASASIGQAHSARTKDGTRVVVKVRRPDAVHQVQQDLEILRNLADLAARTWQPARDYNVVGVVQEFSRTLTDELDYLKEARNAERFAADFAGSNVRIPRVFWETTTSRVLTLEEMSGIKITDIERLEAAGIDRRRLARTGADLILQMVFEHGFFHADPHPGNVFVRPDGDLALIDFGMVGEIDDDLRDRLVDFLLALAAQDPEAIAAALRELSVTRGSVDRETLDSELVRFVGEYAGVALSEVHFARLMTELMRMLREQRLQLPQGVALVIKVLLVIEGIGVVLDPGFDLNAVIAPYARRLVGERLSLASLARRLERAATDAGALALELPSQLRRALRTLDQDGLEVHVRESQVNAVTARLTRMVNRLVAGVITAALIDGVAQVVVRDTRWRPWRGALTGAGLSVVGGLTGYLIWTARRPGRSR